MYNLFFCGLIGVLLLSTATVVNGNPPPACSPPCLYYSKGTAIGAIEYQTRANTTTVPITSRAVAMAADVGDNLIFWSDNHFRTISRMNLTDGRIDKIVADKLGVCDGLAFEWENKFIYWTDFQYKRVEMARVDGSDRRVLFSTGVENPRGIALDPRNGYMFWTDWGTKPKIEKATLAGQQRTTIIDSTMIPMGWPNDIVIDFTENRIYWLEARDDFIAKADFNGGNVAVFARFRQNIHPFSMTLYKNILFWSEWATRSIERLDKVTVTYIGSYGVLASDKVYGITMFDQSRQPIGSHVCNNNADCSHLCMIVPGGYKCGCRNGITMKSDGKTCQKGYTNFLLFADRDSQKLLQLSLDVPIALQMALPITNNVDRPFALDFDPDNGRVYWTDVQTNRILRAFLNGSSQEVIVGSGVVTPAGVALDRVGGNIYWTNFGNKSIEVAKMDGSFRRVLLSLNNQPRDIILDTDNGLMYWTARGSAPTIEQADMDGENRKVLVNTGILLPNALTLDKAGNRLCWSDGGRATVEYLQLDQGNKRTKLFQNNQTLSMPFGLTMLGNYLYFTDWKQQTVVRVDKTTKQQEIIARGLTRPADIRAFAGNSSQTPGSHPCARYNGGCSYLCLLKPGGFKCACPTNPIPGRPCSPGSTPSLSPSKTPATSTLLFVESSVVLISKPTSVSTSTARLAPSSTAKSIVTSPTSSLLVDKSTVVSVATSSSTVLPQPTSSRPSTPTLQPTGESSSSSSPLPPATSLPPVPSCFPNPCQNGGTCSSRDDGEHFSCSCPSGYGSKRCSVYIGHEVVSVAVKMKLEQWNKYRFQSSIVNALNGYCKQKGCRDFKKRDEKTRARVYKRSSSDNDFKPEDVVLVRSPIQSADRLLVDFVVVDTRSTAKKSTVVPAAFLSSFVIEKVDDIGKSLGSQITSINGNSPTKTQTATDSPGSAASGRQTGSEKSGSVVGAAIGGVVALLLVIIIGAVYVLKCRNNAVDRPRVENNVSLRFGPGAGRSTSSFSNPGFCDTDRIYDSIGRNNTVQSPVVQNQGFPAPGQTSTDLNQPLANLNNPFQSSGVAQLGFPAPDRDYASVNPRQSTEYASVNVGSLHYSVCNNPGGSHYMDLGGKRGQNGGLARSTEYEKPNNTVMSREQETRNESNV